MVLDSCIKWLHERVFNVCGFLTFPGYIDFLTPGVRF